jgi:hypothetical protein
MYIILHNTVIDREGLDETSLLELQNQEHSFSTDLDEPERQVARANNRSNFLGKKGKRCIHCLFQ